MHCTRKDIFLLTLLNTINHTTNTKEKTSLTWNTSIQQRSYQLTVVYNPRMAYSKTYAYNDSFPIACLTNTYHKHNNFQCYIQQNRIKWYISLHVQRCLHSYEYSFCWLYYHMYCLVLRRHGYVNNVLKHVKFLEIHRQMLMAILISIILEY